MQPEIEVLLRPASGSGRLRPRYDEEADLLEVSSAAPRPWPFGVDVRGKLIIDLDRDAVLTNFDLLIPRRLWRPSKTLNDPKPVRKADLQFSPETLTHKSFDKPVRVATNEERSCILIDFGQDPVAAGDVVELSSQCFAFVEKRALRGFFVRLAPADLVDYRSSRSGDCPR